ncbi:stage III sporulation protein AF [Clostridium sp. Cult3]|uniref:stage III sporulation protein AF n=1 Tax=Clostridium sp. Cult3 TaxID=2079004 RepID=UPI001F013A60|nr:stage III sporulation protein AF [Clostridium sp. Cult3]MCF6460090.1 stage III sporulation protein AF [Clostridium sp. Cult3]
MKAVSFLRYWIQDIVMIFLIVSIVEILLPNSNMRKYINMVIGFLIIIVIVSPFIKLLSRDYSIDERVLKEHLKMNELVYKDKSNLSSVYDKQVKEMYTNKMELEVTEFVHETSNYKVESVNLSIDETNENFGKLKEIEILLKVDGEEKIDKNVNKNSIAIIKIDDVSIDNNDEAFNAYKTLEDGEDLKKSLSKKFNISKENIRVFLNTLEAGELDGEVYR